MALLSFKVAAKVVPPSIRGEDRSAAQVHVQDGLQMEGATEPEGTKAQRQLAAIKKEEHSDDEELNNEILDAQHDKQLHAWGLLEVDKSEPAPIVTPTDKPTKPPKLTAAKSSASKKKQLQPVQKPAALCDRAVSEDEDDEDDERRTHRYSPGGRGSAASTDELEDARELQIRTLMKANESLRRRLSKMSQEEEAEEEPKEPAPTPAPATRKPKTSPKKPRSPAKPTASPSATKPRSPKKKQSPKKASPKKGKDLQTGGGAEVAPNAVELDQSDDESTASTRGGKIAKKGNMDEATKACRENRLRRLCERKPSGKIKVPVAIHEAYMRGGTERDDLMEFLEQECSWDPELFLKTVEKTFTKRSLKARRKKRGWFTQEGMAKKLLWSKKYIGEVVKYCSKPGRENLVKKDRYQKGLFKYYVEYEDCDSDAEIEEEKEEEKESETVSRNPAKKKLKGVQTKISELPAEEPDESDDEDEKARSKKLTSYQEDYMCLSSSINNKEFKTFQKFGDSLLSKASKLADLQADLESFVQEGSKGPEQKRLNSCLNGLEQAIACLNVEHEKVEAEKVNLIELADKDCSDETAKPLLAKIKEQTKKCRLACSKVAAQENSARTQLKALQKAAEEKAAVKHTVKVAKAAVKDNPNSQARALLQFAAVRTNDAESAAHRIFREHNLTVDIKIDRLNLGQDRSVNSFPFIKLSTWVTYLLDHGLLKKLTGIEDELHMENVLLEFWSRYMALFPEHDLWSHPDIDLSRAIPVYTHTDEGRTYKKRPLLVFSTHGCLGLGSQPQQRAHADDPTVGVQDISVEDSEMNMNFIGSTWGTHFIHASVLKSVSDAEPEVIPGIMKEYAADVQALYNTGVTDSRGQKRVWIVHCGSKGDLLALSKLGHFTRDYTRMPRAAQSKQLAFGICHLCQAGREYVNAANNVPFEDVSSRARWHGTMHQEYPWEQMPPILQGVPRHAPGMEAAFFCVDLWHCWHYGLAKVFVPSVLLVFQETLIPGSSIDARLEWINNDWKSYCKNHKFAAHAIEINKDTMGYTGSTFPTGHWNKGAISTTLMYYLEFLCVCLGVDCNTPNPVHREIVTCIL
ncbi:unnamed protein product [Symbiodinium sp. CCMP2592]|nr:unnamed protein product [Symbiodinium sp. CCMP2592]